MKTKKDCIVCTYYETIMKWLASENEGLSYSTVEVTEFVEVPKISLEDSNGNDLDIQTQFSDSKRPILIQSLGNIVN